MEEIFKISKDEKRAKALKEMALDRFSKIHVLQDSYRKVEEYYEIIKELLTAFMYTQGFKTLSHKALIEFSSREIKSLSRADISLIDELRLKRNAIIYYGEKVTGDFLKSRESTIKKIINSLAGII